MAEFPPPRKTTVRYTLDKFHYGLWVSQRELESQIAHNVWVATNRLYEMHSVGTGVCHCGADMVGHPVWDNHSPVETRVDKSLAPVQVL